MITSDDVKAHSGIAADDASYDDALDELVTMLMPVLEFAVLPEALADEDLLPTLELAFVEVLTGEHFARRARAEATFETVTIGPLSIKPPVNLVDPSGLIDRGMSRLRPYLKPEVAPSIGTVRTGGRS
jgi:hypothetical protein